MIEINLIPAKVKEAKKMQVVYFYAGLIAAAVLLVLVGLVWNEMQAIAKIEKEIKKIDAESASLTDKIAEVKKFNALEESYQKKSGLVAKLISEQSVWTRLLDRISEILLPDMWLIRVEQLRERQEGLEIVLEGFSLSRIAIADFLKRLEMTKNIMDLQAVRIQETTSAEETGSTMRVLRFEIKFLYVTQDTKEGA